MRGGIKVSHYYCVIVNFPFCTHKHLLYILRCSYVGCIYIFNCYIFFLDWSFDHYVVSFFVSFHSLYFKDYLIWCKNCDSCFLLVSICMKYFFPSPSLSVCMCPLFWGRSLIDSIYRDLAFVSIQPVFVFWLGHWTQLLIGMVPLPFALLFWVHVHTTFLCFLSRKGPLAFVEELVWWCWILSAFACL